MVIKGKHRREIKSFKFVFIIFFLLLLFFLSVSQFMENKKRKGKDEEKEEEEMKMDEFYALLRRFRDARDRRRKELEELEKSEKKRKVATEQHSGWVPSFEWEDFANEVEFRGQPLRFTTPSPSPPPTLKQRKNDKHHLHDNSLDLNLAL